MKIYRNDNTSTQINLGATSLTSVLRDMPKGCYLIAYQGEVTMVDIRSAIKDLRRRFQYDFRVRKVETDNGNGVEITKLPAKYFKQLKK